MTFLQALAFFSLLTITLPFALISVVGLWEWLHGKYDKLEYIIWLVSTMAMIVFSSLTLTFVTNL